MTLRRDLVRAVDRHRRYLAAVAAGIAMLAALSSISSSQTPTTSVVVTTREIPAGTVLEETDLTLRQVRTADVPDRAVSDVARLIGRTTGGPVPRHAIATELTVVVGRTASAPGRVVVAVKVADLDMARLVAPGMRVALLTPGSAGGLVTDDALVVATPQQTPGGPLSTGGESRVVIVDVEAGVAERLVRSASTTGVTIALH